MTTRPSAARVVATPALAAAAAGCSSGPSPDGTTAVVVDVGVDLSGPTPRVIARYPTVRQPDSVAVAPGSHVVWVTGTYSGVIERITR